MWHTKERRKKGYKVLVESPKERDHSEDRGIDGKMGLECILGRLAGGVECIHLVQDGDKWWAVANAVIHLYVLAPQS
jgi:hypothetical protein